MSNRLEITTVDGTVVDALLEGDRAWCTAGSFVRLADENFTWLRGRYEKDSPTLRALQVAWKLGLQDLWPW